MAQPWWRVCLAGAALLAVATMAWAQEGQESIRSESAAVVEIRTDRDETFGSGFVVDAKAGLVFTDFHVVEGATKCWVIFPADKDEKRYETEGFVAVLPEKDICLLKIVPGSKKLQSLKIAEKIPDQGEPVFAFGSSAGMSGTVSHGIVTAIRSGKEVAELWDRWKGKGFFKSLMRMDMDCVWIQHCCAGEHGNGGGPLVNKKGEVLGLNTLSYEPSEVGENLNFAISAKHLRELYAKAGDPPQPWSALPKDRGPQRGFTGSGDPKKTLDAWKTFNRGMHEWKKRVDEAQKRQEAIPKPDPRNPMRGMRTRNQKYQAAMRAMGAAYCDFADKIKKIDMKTIDQMLQSFIFRHAIVLERIGKSYKELASSLAMDNPHAAAWADAKAQAYKEILEQFDVDYEALRTSLGRSYETDFPTVEQTAEEDNRNPAGRVRARNTVEAGSGDEDGSGGLDGSGYRIWTSADGEHQIDAKYAGVTEDGQKVRLRKKSDGEEIEVPIKRLVKADQNYIARLLVASRED
jgi:hypothetical protein